MWLSHGSLVELKVLRTSGRMGSGASCVTGIGHQVAISPLSSFLHLANVLFFSKDYFSLLLKYTKLKR